MTNQELIEHFQEQKKIIEKEIAFWQAQPDAESEKPKLRHGGFGYTKDGGIRIRLFDIANPDRGKKVDYNPYGRVEVSDIEYFGNIFDLLKEWSEPFGYYYKHGIRLEESSVVGKDIFIQAGEQWIHLALSEAEEFWHKLGQLIAMKKRQQTK